MSLKITFVSRRISALILIFLVTSSDILQAQPHPGPIKGIVTIDLTQGKPLNRVVPRLALGAAVDGLEEGDIPQVYTPPNVGAMRSSGLNSLSYRLRTELGIEAWHWSSRGSWSDRQHSQGYWTSSSVPGDPILISNGYALPRRGNTIDQANNSGYSRIDDGNPATFWKSNPYLCRPFVPENHPQWIVVGFPKPVAIDSIQIDWGALWAHRFSVEYWSNPDGTVLDSINDTLDSDGAWHPFAGGEDVVGREGWETLRIAPTPGTVQYIRILLKEPTQLPESVSSDLRDRVGYTVRELRVGTTNDHGSFTDLMRHGSTSESQTAVYVSSTDSWHRASDLDPTVEEPGFDRIFHSGLTAGLPVMMPIPLFYGTPENAVAEVKYFRARGYPVHFLELGEEPDGQYLAPEDYGALFIRWADALHAFDPTLKLGGPCFQGMTWTAQAWPDGTGTWQWSQRFIRYLKSHHRLEALEFWSTEAYFFDDIITDPANNLPRVPSIVHNELMEWRREGVPESLPVFVTEYGYSPYATPAEVDLPGALLDADFVGTFLSQGGAGAYFYGIEPNSLMQESTAGAGWGNLTMWLSDDDHKIKAPVAAYYAMQLVVKRWAVPADRPIDLYQAATTITNSQGQALVTAYAARRGDHKWALLIVNKDPVNGYDIQVEMKCNGLRSAVPQNQEAELWQYSREQYRWNPDGPLGKANPNLPPEHRKVRAGTAGDVTLPPYSLTVVTWPAGGNEK